ncbi:hypothetical protein HZA75_07215 [Candidatus Roizmanbacteria bacterium]|nr:hypothetical protein [Candidatus Roizmanbacteria bacterium]
MDFNTLYNLCKNSLSNFGKKPIEDVGKILSIVQSGKLPEEEVMSTTQKVYIKLYQEKKRGDLNQARQSWVVASGNNFEIFVRNLINTALNNEGIIAVKGDQLKHYLKAAEVVKFLTLKASRRCTQTNTGIWPDSDIVLLAQDDNERLKAFALLNCKTSDHSRNDSVLFWALALRDNNIKYCLVTQDLDNRFVKGDKNAGSLRRKCEAYLDRVYTTNPFTEECPQVQKLDFIKKNGIDSLLNDLRVWRKDIIPDSKISPISAKSLE